MKSKANTDMKMCLHSSTDFLVSFPLNIGNQTSCIKPMLLLATMILLSRHFLILALSISCVPYLWKQNTVGHILKLLQDTEFIVLLVSKSVG